jgi:hypothetical protein
MLRVAGRRYLRVSDRPLSLEAARAAVLADFSASERSRLIADVAADLKRVPPDAKVSCRYGDRCPSPSRRDQTKRKAWLCGSGHSHDDRLAGCVAYCRLERSLKDGQSGNRRFAKQ